MPKRTKLFFMLAWSAAAATAATSALAASSAAGSIQYPQPLPSGFSPTSGAAGTVITISGKGFTGLREVWIGNAHNAAIAVVSDNLLKVTVPAGATTSHLGFINPQHSEFTSTNFTVTSGSGGGSQAATISGAVAGPAATTVLLMGRSTRTAGLGAGGDYSFNDVADGAYTLLPQVNGHVFTPASVAANVTGTALKNMNFAAVATSAASYKISGAISGPGADGASVTLNGENVGSAATDLGGSFSFSGLAAGTYTLAASLRGSTFSQERTVTIGKVDSSNNNFSSSTSGTASNIVITTDATLPAAHVGKPYSALVVKSVAGNKGAYHFQTGEYSTGTPPLGMILNANGTLSGTPKRQGTYNFEICAADVNGDVSAKCASTSITVAAAGGGGGGGSGGGAPPPPGTSWVYYNGAFDWPGDYSFVASPNYTDTSGDPLSGPYDIKVSLEGAWGGWLPYAKNWDFDSKGYTKLTFALKPTVAGQVWSVYFVKVGDVPVGIYLDVSNYGPAPVPGKWATYTVPLSDLGVLGTDIYKFCIQDKTGRSSNTWYVDNVGFVP